MNYTPQIKIGRVARNYGDFKPDALLVVVHQAIGNDAVIDAIPEPGLQVTFNDPVNVALLRGDWRIIAKIDEADCPVERFTRPPIGVSPSYFDDMERLEKRRQRRG